MTFWLNTTKQNQSPTKTRREWPFAEEWLPSGLNESWDSFFKNSDRFLVPSAEVTEEDEHYNLKLEVPGVEEKDIDVKVTRNEILVKGKREKKVERTEKGVTSSEFSYGSFMRSFPFSKEVNPENVKASLKDGILNIQVEKSHVERTNSRTIPVTRG